MRTRKEQAFDLILKGTLLQYVPLMILGATGELLEQSNNSLLSFLTTLIVFVVLGTFVAGYIFLIKGCSAYSKSKGYSSILGWLGLLSLLGLTILLLIPSRDNQSIPELSDVVNSSHLPFYKLNIPELNFLFIVALPILYIIPIAFFCLLYDQSFIQVIEKPLVNSIIIIFCLCHFGFLLLQILKKADLELIKILGFKNNISVKEIIVISLSRFAFAYSFNPLALYTLSFIFPGYVEEYINEKSFSTVLGFILSSISAVLLAPILEELLYRGLILQKWALKWGIKWGIIWSSLLFALIHVRFDILPLFIGGVFYSMLYLKTSNLLAPMLCHALYNSLVVFWQAIDFWGSSENEREKFISVSDYQDYVQPIIDRNIVLTIIFVLFLAYLFKRFLRRDYKTIPYLKKQSI